jgi:hypothetical protein
MSEIPFVNQLGDALETAIAKPARAPRLRRLGRRRYLAVALAALAVTGGSAAVAGLFHDPVEIGFGAVGCFDGPDTDGNVSVLSDPNRSPLAICASVMTEQGLDLGKRDLIACSWGGHGIVVVAHEGRRSCRAHDLLSVPAGYTSARKRAARLDADVKRYEREAGCVPPAEFARGLTQALHAAGWGRWRAVPGDGQGSGEGPCGRVSAPTGSELLGPIGSQVDAAHRTITVMGAFPLALEEFVYGADSPGVRLYDESGARCFNTPELEQHVRETFAPTGVPVRFTVKPLQPGVSIADSRGARYADGCTVFAAASIRYPDKRTEILVELNRRD